MTLKEIVLEYLKEHDYNGLSNSEMGCDCSDDEEDFMSCGEPGTECEVTLFDNDLNDK